MCLSPKYIPNQSRRFTDGYSRQFIAVPCGHCKECLKMNENEWFVRAFMEYQRCEKSGGRVWFVLMTYDQEHLPYYECSESGFTCPCFDPAHIKHFRDSLRVNIMRDIEKGIINAPMPSDEYQIKFMCCPEYGEETGRSHYHNLIFMPFELPEEYVIGKWQFEDGHWRLRGGLIERCWPYGFVSWSVEPGTRRLRPFLESDGGVEYTMKYVNKDGKWAKEYMIPEYREWLKDNIRMAKRIGDTSKEEYWTEILRQFKRVMPRRYTSTNFGVSALRYYQNDDESWNIDKLVDGRIDLTDPLIGKLPNPDKPTYVYNMPRYLKRKIMYNLDKDKLWRLNPLGVTVARRRYDLTTKWASERFAPYFQSVDYMKEHLSYCSGFMDELNAQNEELGQPTFDIDRDFALMQQLMNGRSVDDLVMYDKVYRNIALAWDNHLGASLTFDPSKYAGRDFNPHRVYAATYNHWVDECLDKSPKEMMDVFRRHAIDFYIAQQTLDREPDAKNHARCKYKEFYNPRHGFECFDCFKDFDTVLAIIERYESLLGNFIQEAYDVTEKRKKDIMSFQGNGFWCNV